MWLTIRPSCLPDPCCQGSRGVGSPGAWPTGATEWWELAPESWARRASGESQSCPGECWSLPHASEIVISFTQLVGPHKVEGKSELLGKENSPAFSLSYIVVQRRFILASGHHQLTLSFSGLGAPFFRLSHNPAPAFCIALRFLTESFYDSHGRLLPKSLAFHFHLFYTFGDSHTRFPPSWAYTAVEYAETAFLTLCDQESFVVVLCAGLLAS